MLSRHDRIPIWICIGLITALAWAYLFHLDRQMSAEMRATGMDVRMVMPVPHTATDVALTFAMWAVMMVGMMAGSAAPVLLMFANAQAARARTRLSTAVILFGAGYLVVWTVFSAAATLAQELLHRASLLTMMMTTASPRVAGVLLIVAGIYQLTPFKSACLTHCRSPLGFLMGHWRDGTSGAFRMGLTHGAYCLGCCWAVMALLFVFGVMNLLWIAALTILVLVEKVGPAGVVVARVAGGAMIVAGLVAVARPF